MYPSSARLGHCSRTSADHELDPLCQREVHSVVDRGRLAPGVGLPGIAAALTASAGILLATECPADLRARRTRVHVDQTAVRAAV